MNESIKQLVLGTRNRKKRSELQTLLVHYPIDILTLDDFPDAIEIDETGSCFIENAALKAELQARHLESWVLGEDSGLSVLALDGEPGVHSARYAGASADDDANNQKLLAEMANVPDDKRSAWYTCAMVLADPSGASRIECQGHCHGRIIRRPRGEHGFGYDPLFEIPEYHKTFAELGLAVKSLISHRARAMRELLKQLIPLVSRDKEPAS